LTRVSLAFVYPEQARAICHGQQYASLEFPETAPIDASLRSHRDRAFQATQSGQFALRCVRRPARHGVRPAPDGLPANRGPCGAGRARRANFACSASRPRIPFTTKGIAGHWLSAAGGFDLCAAECLLRVQQTTNREPSHTSLTRRNGHHFGSNRKAKGLEIPGWRGCHAAVPK